MSRVVMRQKSRRFMRRIVAFGGRNGREAIRKRIIAEGAENSCAEGRGEAKVKGRSKARARAPTPHKLIIGGG